MLVRPPDHRLIRSKINLQLAKKKQPARVKPPRKLNVSLLNAASVILQQKPTEALGEVSNTANANAEGEWCALSRIKNSRAYWFDENDPDISKLLDMLHKKHHEYLADKTCQKKKDHYQQGKQLVQSRLRQMNAWWERRSEDLPAAADARDMKTFHHGLRAVYEPKSRGTTPVRAADQTTLLTDKADILTR